MVGCGRSPDRAACLARRGFATQWALVLSFWTRPKRNEPKKKPRLPLPGVFAIRIVSLVR